MNGLIQNQAERIEAPCAEMAQSQSSSVRKRQTLVVVVEEACWLSYNISWMIQQKRLQLRLLEDTHETLVCEACRHARSGTRRGCHLNRSFGMSQLLCCKRRPAVWQICPLSAVCYCCDSGNSQQSSIGLY